MQEIMSEINNDAIISIENMAADLVTYRNITSLHVKNCNASVQNTSSIYVGSSNESNDNLHSTSMQSNTINGKRYHTVSTNDQEK